MRRISWGFPPVNERRRKVSRRPAVGKEVRERILAGATEAFGKLGHAGTRVEDILEASGVSRPTFYKAFDSKDAVFEELSDRHHRDIRERIVQSLVGVTDPRAQLEATTEAFLGWRAELGPMGRALDVEARIPGSSIAHHRSRTLDDMTSLMAEHMRALGRGEADPVLYRALIASMEAVADALLSKPPVSAAALERAKQNALRILIGALAAPGDDLPPLPAPPGKGLRG